MFKEGAQLSILHGATSPCPPQLPPPLCLSLTLLTAAPPTAKRFLPRGHRLCHSSGLEHRAPDAGHCPPPFRHLSGITRGRPHAPIRTVLPRAPLLCSVLCSSPASPPGLPASPPCPLARPPARLAHRRPAECMHEDPPRERTDGVRGACGLWTPVLWAGGRGTSRQPLQGRRMSDSFSSPKHHFSLV